MVTPTMPPETKTEILEEVLERLGVGTTVRRFVHVLQRHFRLEQMPEILTAYRDEVDRSLGRVRARVELAAPLADRDTTRLVSVLEDVVDATVVAEFVDKPELLAGFRAQVGSKVFDGSLVGQIDQLRRQAGGEQR
jgi:F-type H+-transporting ATPase subunit delta